MKHVAYNNIQRL